MKRTDMYSILAAMIVIFDAVLSFQTRNSYEVNGQEIREKRQYSPVIPIEVKEEFKNYAKSYLNNMVAQMSKRKKAPKQEESSTSRARICAEVCHHRCLPSCEWSCCIKENIEEYRQAHLVQPLVPHLSIQRKSDLADVNVGENQEAITNVKSSVVNGRENIEEPLKDGKECNPSCKRYCVPSCRFSCCQPVQIKGVLLL